MNQGIRDRLLHAFGDFGMTLMRWLPAEMSHELGLKLMSQSWFPSLPSPDFKVNFNDLATNVPGLGQLKHPVGLAAGFDKHAQAPLAFASLCCSFVEIGTVTPRAQSGNPKPRLFRFKDQQAIINRMGFNSHGSQAVAERLSKLAPHERVFPIGVNLGKNKDTANESAVDDYNHGLERFRNHASYFVINISSPNTEGLRNLATPGFLAEIARDNRENMGKIWLKLDPDSSKKDFQMLIEAAGSLGFQGVILTNTHKVSKPQSGGQSGHPLAILANAKLEWAWEVHQGSLPMIASGGIFSGCDVIERIARGAHAVQVYSALVYRGPWAVSKMLREMQDEMELRGIIHLDDFRGSYYN